jgi:hypothetical protein
MHYADACFPRRTKSNAQQKLKASPKELPFLLTNIEKKVYAYQVVFQVRT